MSGMFSYGGTMILEVLRRNGPRFNIVALQLPKWSRNEIWMMHSQGEATWAKIGQSLDILSYEYDHQVSYHLAKPKWYLLYKHLC